MKKSTFTKLRYLLISITVTLALAVPGSFIAMPHLLRWKYTSQLTSPNLKLREQGLSYVIIKAKDDPLVRDAAFAKLAIVTGDNFTQIQNALDNAQQWKRPIVPKAIWLRWCVMLGNQTDPKGRILGTQMAAELADDVDDPKLHEFLLALLKDSDADVRYNALTTTASLAGDTDSAKLFLAEFKQAVKDSNPVVAREAWVFLGIFKLADFDITEANKPEMPEPGFPAWYSGTPAVKDAMVWALLQSHPEPADWHGFDPYAVGSPSAPIAAYCLHLRRNPGGKELADQISAHLEKGSKEGAKPEDVLVAWRTLFSMPALVRTNPGSAPVLDLDVVNQTVKRVSSQFGLSLTSLAPTTQPASALPGSLAYVQSGLGLPPSGIQSALERLGYVEGFCSPWARQSVGSATERPELALDPDSPEMLRLAVVRASVMPRPDDLYPLFSSDESTMRDLAVHVAATRMTSDQNRSLIRKALTDFNDHAKMSGAILSGLTGLEAEFLEKKLSESRIWEVEQLMQVGLWMQGKLPSFEQKSLDLLTRADLPRSTLVVAQLHHGNTIALEYLLNPQGEPTMDLVDLFDPKRWSIVMWMYLPDDAPSFWVWADPDLERFQVDVLRNWFLVHRKTLKLPGDTKIRAMMKATADHVATTRPATAK